MRDPRDRSPDAAQRSGPPASLRRLRGGSAQCRPEADAFRMPWLGMATTILLFGGLLGFFRQELIGFFARFGPERADRNATLEVTAAGDSLQIVFPRGARKGVLSIQDGEGLRRFNLSEGDLAGGRFTYRSGSTDLTIRLETDGGTASARVLRQPEVEVATTKPSPEPAPSLPAPAPPVVEPPVDAAAASQPEAGAADRAATAPPPDLSIRKVPAPLPKALRSVRGILRVDVQVTIAADGSVQSAELATAANSRYFDRISLQAAQASRFDPTDGGASRTLRYEYTREGVQMSEVSAK